MCSINPKDVKACNIKLSNHTEDCNFQSRNVNILDNSDNGDAEENDTKPPEPIEPELGGGIGGYNLDTLKKK